MRVTIRVSGQLRAALGVASLDVALDEAASVSDAIVSLAEGRGAAVRAALMRDGGDIQPTLVIAVGSDQVSDPAGHSLRDGDTVTILHPISGG